MPTTGEQSTSQPVFILRDSRVWIIWLWATVLGLGTGGVAAALSIFASQAAERNALVLPAGALGEEGRTQLRTEILAEEGIAKVSWISPQNLAQRTASSISRQLWGELHLGDDDWLPWIAEIRFEDPINNSPAIKETVASLRRNEMIRLVRWDQKSIDREREKANRVRAVAIPVWGLIFVLGGVALWLAPLQAPLTRAKGAALGLIPTLIVIATLGGAQGLGAPADGRTYAAGAAIAFILAGVIAPMLVQRTSLK